MFLSSCGDGVEQSYSCISSTTYDGYVPQECSSGQKISLKKNKSYSFVIKNTSWTQNIFASLFSLITKWDETKPEYYDLQSSEIVSIKHNGIEEKIKPKKKTNTLY